MATPKRLTSRSRSISASTWNQYADAVTRFNSPENGTGPSPEYTENLAFAKTDGDFIPPHTVCRIVARYNLEEKDPSLVGYVVRPLNTSEEVGGKPANYAITGSEGVDKDFGSAYVSGMAIVKVTMEEAVSGEGVLVGFDSNDPENQYEGQHDAAYYIADDATLSTKTGVRIAPFGHFKITSFYVADDFEGAESVFLCVNMDRPSTTIRVKTSSTIPAVEELTDGSDVPTGEFTMSVDYDAEVFYSMVSTTPSNDYHSIEKSDNFSVKIFNPSDSVAGAGIHLATYSREYNRFLLVPKIEQGVKIGKADADIAVGATGTISIWRNGLDTSENEDARLDWMAGSDQVSAGKEVLITWFADEALWRITGAECES